MSELDHVPLKEIAVERDNLYQEEIFTDLKVATLRRLTPIKPDGSPDPSRQVVFTAQTTLMSAAGPVPVSAPIDARTLEEAMDQFPEAINRAVERLIEEAREFQRQEASRIVVPGSPIMGGGGLPGGGKMPLG